MLAIGLEGAEGLGFSSVQLVAFEVQAGKPDQGFGIGGGCHQCTRVTLLARRAEGIHI